MALSAVVTQAGVSKRHKKLWDISLQMVLSDDAIPVLTQTFSAPYKQGQDLNALYASLLADMQAVIDDYKTEQVYVNHAQMTNLISALNSNLTV